ncbi:MAG: hypothetical protein WBA74_15480 [Cyclobacteriaceae bacterium]
MRKIRILILLTGVVDIQKRRLLPDEGNKSADLPDNRTIENSTR